MMTTSRPGTVSFYIFSYGHVQKKVALEIDFLKCILKIVIALCWLLYLSRPLEIRCNYMMLKSRSLYCLYHMSYRY